MKTIILLAIFGLFLIVVSSNAKSLSNDNDMELTDKRARMFLRTLEGDDDGDDDDDDDDDNDANAGSLDTRQTGKQCVKCKFGIARCCAPNFCRKKFLRPDECVEVKTGK